jgi:hypothetical protein
MPNPHGWSRVLPHPRKSALSAVKNLRIGGDSSSVRPLQSDAESIITVELMKRVLFLFLISAAFPCALFASDSLPFPVSVGGQAAKDGTPFAKIENPVAADAELSVDTKSDMIIVNVGAVNAKNEPAEGATPAVILLRNKTKTTLDKTMDNKKLAAGNYLMSVVSEGKTASILFTIK